MLRSVLLIAGLTIIFAGCATTRGGSQVESLETEVARLQEQLKYKNDEIRTLQYKLDRLSSKLEAQEQRRHMADEGESLSKKDIPGYKEEGIIRMPVSVEDVQTALQNAGFYEGKIDGKVGNQTKKAIADFQQANDLVMDGIIGVKTWETLKSYLNP